MRRVLHAGLIAVHLLAGIALSALPAPRQGPARLWPLHWWSRRLGRILGLRLSISGATAEQPVLLLANHISWLDIICLASACPTYFLAKGDVARWPLFRWLCRRSGTLFIERGTGAEHACEQIGWRLRGGHRLVIFPEGTSSNGQSVRRFHARLVQAAQRAKVPVQPVMIAYPQAVSEGLQQPNPTVPFVGDDDLLRHLWRLLGKAHIEARLRFGPVFDSQQHERSALARVSENYIRLELATLYEEPGSTSTLTQRALLDETRESLARRARY